MMPANKLAKYIVQQAHGQRGRHFSVLEAYGQPVPFPYHWRIKNARGVTFPRDQTETAEAWSSKRCSPDISSVTTPAAATDSKQAAP
jgi:hypothetical protein